MVSLAFSHDSKYLLAQVSFISWIICGVVPLDPHPILCTDSGRGSGLSVGVFLLGERKSHHQQQDGQFTQPFLDQFYILFCDVL